MYGINLNKWQQLSAIIKPYALEYIVKQLHPGVELSQKNLDQAVNFFENSRVGSSTHLSTGLHLIRDYASVIITLTAPRDKVANLDMIVPLRSGQIYQSGMFRLKHRIKPVETAAPQAYTNTSDLYVRYWQPGDRVQPFGMAGSKKLQDVFVDQKVPRNLRRRWPVVVTADNQVVWVPTLASDRRFTTDQVDQAAAQLICELV
jgi:tRNA(Ile)-lysidine synthase